ncbi:MAG: DUF488 domain-containing protein [Patescibacteria group bacterium]
MLLTKCIYLSKSAEDGLRVSIMSRHTLANGTTPDLQITSSSYDMHWPELGPPTRLIGKYLRHEIDWPGFEEVFVQFLRTGAAPHLDRLIHLALTQNVTLLCREKSGVDMIDGKLACHRRLVAEECKRLRPELALSIA